MHAYVPCWRDAGEARRPRGYSMVELLLVITLIGILVALAAPSFDTSNQRGDEAMQEVGTSLLAAQRSALAKQHSVVVSFDAPARLIRILDDQNENGIADPGERVRLHTLPEKIVFGRGTAPDYAQAPGNGSVSFTRRSGGLPAVTFLRNGTASEEGGVYLTSTRASRGEARPGDARVVVVARATGRTSWLSYATGSWKREF